MKKLNHCYIMVLIIIFVSFSCQKGPIASFEFDKNNVESPVTIHFTNNSTDATDFLWSFGDGGTSKERDPNHEYIAWGNFTVTLNATGEGGANSISKSISILKPALLGNWNIVEGTYDGSIINGLTGYFNLND